MISIPFYKLFKPTAPFKTTDWRQSQSLSHRDTAIIHTIDEDVLISIFLETLDIACSPHPPAMSRTHPAVIVTHVCRRWRKVGLAVGALWKKIHLVIRSYPQNFTPVDPGFGVWKVQLSQSHQMMKTWISRAGASHLHIIVSETSMYPQYLPSHCDEEARSELARLIDTLLETSSRWKELQLKLNFSPSQTSSFPTARFLSLPPQNVPVLTHVRLDMNWTSDSQPIADLLISKPVSLCAASLHSLELVGRTMLHCDLKDLPTRWSTLRHLSFRGYPRWSPRVFDEARALQIFRLCPNLASCHLHFSTGSDHPQNFGSPVTLRYLEDIRFITSKWDIVKGFASSLILPALQKFILQSVDGSPSPALHYSESGLCEFTERFGSTLRVVDFEHTTLNPEALRQCLTNLTKVVTLTLTDPRAGVSSDSALINVELLRDLTPQFDVVQRDGADILIFREQLLCPMLEELFFPIPPSSEGSDTALAELIVMRRKAWLITSAVGEKHRIGRLKMVAWNGLWNKALGVAKELRRRSADDNQVYAQDIVDLIESTHLIQPLPPTTYPPIVFRAP